MDIKEEAAVTAEARTIKCSRRGRATCGGGIVTIAHWIRDRVFDAPEI
jgi:hypothetical protein